MYTMYCTDHPCSLCTARNTHVHHVHSPAWCQCPPIFEYNSLCSTGLAPSESKSKNPIFQKTIPASTILIGTSRSVMMSLACVDIGTSLCNLTYVCMYVLYYRSISMHTCVCIPYSFFRGSDRGDRQTDRQDR